MSQPLPASKDLPSSIAQSTRYSIDASLYFEVTEAVDPQQVRVDDFNPHNPSIVFRSELQFDCSRLKRTAMLDIIWALNTSSPDEAFHVAVQRLPHLFPLPHGFSLIEVQVEPEVYDNLAGEWMPVTQTTVSQVPQRESDACVVTALERALPWLEANTDDDPAIVPALIQGYIALAKHYGTNPLAIRRQRTSPHDSMPRIVEGIGDRFESEWEWGNRVTQQFLSQHPPTSASIEVIHADSCMISVRFGDAEIASCQLPEIEPFEAQFCLEVIKLCLQFHGFSLIDAN